MPEGAVTVFSAHGVPQSVVKTAQARGPAGAGRHLPAGFQSAQSGQALCRARPHPDPDRPCRTSRSGRHHGPGRRAGASGPVGSRCRDAAAAADQPVAYITQTTLSIDDTKGIIVALKKRFRDIVGPETSDICYATQNRQTSVRELAKVADVILVVGAKNSSNSNRLREIGIEEGVPSYLDRRRQRIEGRLGAGQERGGSHRRAPARPRNWCAM